MSSSRAASSSRKTRCVSPTSTSEPATSPPPSLARAAAGDLLMTVLALVGANTALGGVVVLVFVFARTAAGHVDVPRGDALLTELMSPLLVASVVAMLFAALLTWWVRARRLPVLPAMRATIAYPLAIAAG